MKDGLFPNIPYPRVPGHEVAGVVDAVGQGVVQWSVGQRVGVGWFGGNCGHCEQCRRGNFFACVTGQVTGISFDGGYGEYMIAPASAVALIPAELPAIEAAPLMCAGITTFNALRNSGAQTGRSRRDSWARRAGAFGRAVCGEDGLQDRGHCARPG